jgi:hypothetical protein
MHMHHQMHHQTAPLDAHAHAPSDGAIRDAHARVVVGLGDLVFPLLSQRGKPFLTVTDDDALNLHDEIHSPPNASRVHRDYLIIRATWHWKHMVAQVSCSHHLIKLSTTLRLK